MTTGTAGGTAGDQGLVPPYIPQPTPTMPDATTSVPTPPPTPPETTVLATATTQPPRPVPVDQPLPATGAADTLLACLVIAACTLAIGLAIRYEVRRARKQDTYTGRTKRG